MELSRLNLNHQVTSFVVKAVAFDLTLRVGRAGLNATDSNCLTSAIIFNYLVSVKFLHLESTSY